MRSTEESPTPGTEPGVPRSGGEATVPSGVARAVRERPLLVVGAAVFAALLMLAAGVVWGTVYRAEAVVAVEPRDEPGGAVPSVEDLPEEVLSAAGDEDLMREAMRESGWDSGERGFREGLDVETFMGRGGVDEIVIGFSHSDADTAARAANAYAALLAERAQRLGEIKLAGGSLAARTSLREEARQPLYASVPWMLSWGGAATCAGLVAGGAAASLLERRGRSWLGVRDVETTLGVPVLGAVPERAVDDEDGGGSVA